MVVPPPPPTPHRPPGEFDLITSECKEYNLYFHYLEHQVFSHRAGAAPLRLHSSHILKRNPLNPNYRSPRGVSKFKMSSTSGWC